MPVRRTISALVIAAALFAGCTASGSTSVPASQAPASQAPASAASGPMTIGTATSPTLGSYLVGPNGLALYTHTGDSATSSTCTGSCAVAWPPLIVASASQAVAGSGVTGALASLTRSDGTVQVTYLGLPLYYWKGDTKAGDTTGEDVNGFLIANVSGPAPAPSTTGKPGY
jgi:predicted lipoprotein with Yx(FWY)xxD motif